jgi:protoporphyrin/coproporphyrin ferrochelatase
LLRLPIARLAARRRARTARGIYARLGGASPLVANTEAQASALDAALGDGYRSFVAMRYWHPTSDEAAAAVKAWQPDDIICLPLYPQFSTTTTGSSLAAWRRATARHGLQQPRTVCCYPGESGFVEAMAGLIEPALERASECAKPPRLLLTAHGLPKKIVDAGDPYAAQVELSARLVVTALVRPDLDWRVCYQSRVGPLEWIGPYTEDEIRRAGSEGVPLVVAPVSFVSEHSETLVELDIDYRRLAENAGVPAYFRVPTVGADPAFIAGLAATVRRTHTELKPVSCSAIERGRCSSLGAVA